MHNTPEVESPKNNNLQGTINKTMQNPIITKRIIVGNTMLLK
jgi:hypothetical protein